MKNYRQYLSIDPEMRFGKPCVTGTGIAVGDVLAGGRHERTGERSSKIFLN